MRTLLFSVTEMYLIAGVSASLVASSSLSLVEVTHFDEAYNIGIDKWYLAIASLG